MIGRFWNEQKIAKTNQGLADWNNLVRDIVDRELTLRGIMDRDIFRIGEFGNEHARAAAIDLLKSRLDSNHAP